MYNLDIKYKQYTKLKISATKYSHTKLQNFFCLGKKIE